MIKKSKEKIVKAKAEQQKKINVLFAISEAEPFVKTGGLGDVGGSMPMALANEGVNVAVVLPKYSAIAQDYNNEMRFICDINVNVGHRDYYCGIFALSYKKINYYFIDNEEMFKRDGFYGYEDDALRMAFFSKAVLEALPKMEHFPDIIHSHDWHTAMIPVFLREFYMQAEGYDKIKTVFTVHNLKFQGIFPHSVLGEILGLRERDSSHQLIKNDAVNYMQGALLYSDRLTTVSPAYADEIKTSHYGEGLEDIFRGRESILSGILNGIDKDAYDSKKDVHITANYGLTTLNKKSENKTAIQQEVNLPVDKDIPLIAIVSRLTSQKGMEFVVHIAEEMLNTENVQILVLGTGDANFEHDFRYFADKYPEKLAFMPKFDTPLSHRIYAGADMLLMPSKFEPCGLAQMIAMGYGTLPIVRETGGLRDSVYAYDEYTGEGTGFSFEYENAHDMFNVIKYALSVYKSNKKAWQKLQKSAMRVDFSWKKSAEKYKEIYMDLLK